MLLFVSPIVLITSLSCPKPDTHCRNQEKFSMAEVFVVATGVICVAAFALQSIQQLIGTIDAIKDVPATLACVQQDLRALTMIPQLTHRRSNGEYTKIRGSPTQGQMGIRPTVIWGFCGHTELKSTPFCREREFISRHLYQI